jgi:hypothetical protein
MTTLLQRDAVVGPNSTIEVQVPELAPGQRVRLIIEAGLVAPSGRASDLLAQTDGHRLFKTASEVDAYLRAERDGWER